MNINVLNDKQGIEDMIVLKYFTLNSDGNDYIIYKNNKSGFINKIYAARIDEINGQYKLTNITNEKIIAEIKDIAKELYNEKL